MHSPETKALLLRGTLYPHLERVVKEIDMPLQRIASPRVGAIKYGTFIEKKRLLITISQQRDKRDSLPNIVLAVASPSSQINNSIVDIFESGIQAILDTKFPRSLEIELEKGLIYFLRLLEENRERGMALLRGDVTRDYLEIWERYHQN